MVKAGVSTNISTKHQCITAMKEYESKSLEVSKNTMQNNNLLISLEIPVLSARPQNELSAHASDGFQVFFLPPRWKTHVEFLIFGLG